MTEKTRKPSGWQQHAQNKTAAGVAEAQSKKDKPKRTSWWTDAPRDGFSKRAAKETTPS